MRSNTTSPRASVFRVRSTRFTSAERTSRTSTPATGWPVSPSITRTSTRGPGPVRLTKTQGVTVIRVAATRLSASRKSSCAEATMR